MAEAVGDEPVVRLLHEVEEVEVFFLGRSDRLSDEVELHEGYYQFGHSERDEQDGQNSPWKIVNGVVHRTSRCNQEGEERDRDSHRGREDALEEVSGRLLGGMPARHALTEFLHVGVDDDDGVVDNHAQRRDKGCQRHRVQFDVERIKQP